MKPPALELRYPLAWAAGRPRAQAADRRPAAWRDAGRRLTWTTAIARLRDQVGLVTRNGQPWRVTDQVVSCDIRFTLAGTRDQNISRRDPSDPGVAFYFSLDGHPHVLACDRWDTVYDNLGAIAAHIEALRGQERWGVADMAQAFAGHVALPAPEPWWTTLGLTRDATRSEADVAYRSKARFAHPDVGGDRAAWDRLTAAYEQAKESCR